MSQTVRGKALVGLIKRYLREGATIEVDGLGSFQLNANNCVVFEPNGRIRVFLAYAEEDRAEVTKLYYGLREAGFEPWMDIEKLLPGQNWPRAIEQAIDLSDFFLACFSHRSTIKRGYFQSELRYALDLACRVPLEDIYLVPVRLNDCKVPHHIARKTQYVDLFPDWNRGINTVIKMMRVQTIQKNDRLKIVGQFLVQ